MVIELVKKEYVRRREYTSKSDLFKAFQFSLKLILVALFVTLEVFIFKSLDEKITSYSESTLGDYTFTLDFLIFFLFIIMIMDIIISMVKARNVLFDHYDNLILLPLPISSGELIFSKIIYIYLQEVVLELLVATPLLITFGATRIGSATEIFNPSYFVLTILYPLFISLFTVGASLLLLPIYEFLYKLIKLSDIAQFILACALMITLCYAYQLVLNLFLNALNDSSIGGMFSEDFIYGVHNAVPYFLPIYFLLNGILKGGFSNIAIYLGSVLVVLSLGVGLISAIYIKLSRNEINLKINKKHKVNAKIVTPFKALLKKEFALIFKDSGNMFSYTSLLIMCPFLSFVVISSLNSILYSSLKQFLVYFPELINALNLTLVLLFSSVINASASLSLSREGKCIEIVKYLPIDPFKQLLAKLIIPTFFSSLSLIITCLVLVASGNLEVGIFFVSLITGLILIFATNVIGILIDMHDKSTSKVKLKWLNELISLGVPLLLFGVAILLSLAKVNSFVIYLVLILITSLLLLPCLIKIKSRANNAFNKMEIN